MPPERPLPGWPAGVRDLREGQAWVPSARYERARVIVRAEEGSPGVRWKYAGGGPENVCMRRSFLGWILKMQARLDASPAPCGSSPRDGG